MTDELSAPLGQRPTRQDRQQQWPTAIPQLIAGALGLFVCVFAAWALVVEDPLGGEPVAVVAVSVPPPKIAHATPAAMAPAPGPRRSDTPAAEERTPAPPADGRGAEQTITIIDGSTGKRDVVAIPTTTGGTLAEQRTIDPPRHPPTARIASEGQRRPPKSTSR